MCVCVCVCVCVFSVARGYCESCLPERLQGFICVCCALGELGRKTGSFQMSTVLIFWCSSQEHMLGGSFIRRLWIHKRLYCVTQGLVASCGTHTHTRALHGSTRSPMIWPATCSLSFEAVCVHWSYRHETVQIPQGLERVLQPAPKEQRQQRFSINNAARAALCRWKTRAG